MSTWPDGTPKSTNNAFDWRNRAPTVEAPKSGPIPARAKDMNANSSIFTIYSKAVASIGSFPSVAVSSGERGAPAAPAKTKTKED